MEEAELQEVLDLVQDLENEPSDHVRVWSATRGQLVWRDEHRSRFTSLIKRLVAAQREVVNGL